MDRDYIWEGEYGRRSHLIPVFQQLLREKHIQYAVPTLTKKTLETIVNEIMPDAEIRRDYVVRFVWQNYERLCAM